MLFLGNSYTYFWNLPQTVEAMAASQGFPLIARQSTAGGATWQEHWDGEKDLKSKSIITEGDWDMVVLQNHSRSTLRSMDQFLDYGKKFIDLTRSIGATPVLYQTWSRQYNPLMLEQISKGYDQLAKQEGVEVVRIGELWAEALNQRSDLQLYDPDQSHPSPIGTYLTSAAFYAFLTGGDATKLKNRIVDKDRNGQKLYLSIMSEEDAEFLLQLVDRLFDREEVNDGR